MDLNSSCKTMISLQFFLVDPDKEYKSNPTHFEIKYKKWCTTFKRSTRVFKWIHSQRCITVPTTARFVVLAALCILKYLFWFLIFCVYYCLRREMELFCCEMLSITGHTFTILSFLPSLPVYDLSLNETRLGNHLTHRYRVRLTYARDISVSADAIESMQLSG